MTHYEQNETVPINLFTALPNTNNSAAKKKKTRVNILNVLALVRKGNHYHEFSIQRPITLNMPTAKPPQCEGATIVQYYFCIKRASIEITKFNLKHSKCAVEHPARANIAKIEVNHSFFAFR